MQFYDFNKCKGHLEVWKHFPSGDKELHYEEDNVICSGMGATLAEMMDAPLDTPVDNFQIAYFQLGTSGSSEQQVSSTSQLSSILSQEDYGTGFLDISVHDMLSNGAVTAEKPFGVIPANYIKRVSPRRVMYQIVVDERSCNVGEGEITNLAGGARQLNEIGLWSKNPYHSSYSTDTSMLCAYRYFKPIYKTDSFILVFRWTIEF
jgi:hypothetical protein